MTKAHRATLIERLSLLATLWLGFGLRLFQLGRDSFWADEAGQIYVALLPSIPEMFALQRLHAMAMPLDYLATRGMRYLGLHEMILRFPAAMWGFLTLPVCYILIRRLWPRADRNIALITTLLLAVAPLHVQYAQEMRFYAALTFFYHTATYWGVRAMQRGARRTWAIFTGVAIVGVYFHPYVALSVVTTLLLYLLWYFPEPVRRLRWLLSTVIIALGALPGYAYFGAHQRYDYPLLLWEDNWLTPMLEGLGWGFLPYAEATQRMGWWGWLNAGFAVIGLVALIRRLNFTKRRPAPILILLVSSIIQSGLIIVADALKGYWFASRQLLHLNTVALALTAWGVIVSARWLQAQMTTRMAHDATWLRRLVLGAMIGVLLLASLPMLGHYYAWPKSNGKPITRWLIEHHQEEADILNLGYDAMVYLYYFQALDAPELQAAFTTTTWDDLAADMDTASPTAYLIAPAALSAEERATIEALGFTEVFTPAVRHETTKTIFYRGEE